jgi:Zn finger protein HypA/HybF involved in hydrogenase expression
MAQMAAQRAEQLRQLSERERKQATCSHVFKSVIGTTAYLQCPKCGMRRDND